jgi:hypothetical protein
MCGQITSLMSGLYWVAVCDEHAWQACATTNRVAADVDLEMHRSEIDYARPPHPSVG